MSELKVAAYCRVSTDRYDKNQALKRRFGIIRNLLCVMMAGCK